MSVASERNDFFVCPQCGAEVRKKALSCPQCGSDKETGWSEFTYLDGVTLPGEEDLDYSETLERELGSPPKAHGMRTIAWVAVVSGILFAATALGLVRLFVR